MREITGVRLVAVGAALAGLACGDGDSPAPADTATGSAGGSAGAGGASGRSGADGGGGDGAAGAAGAAGADARGAGGAGGAAGDGSAAGTSAAGEGGTALGGGAGGEPAGDPCSYDCSLVESVALPADACEALAVGSCARWQRCTPALLLWQFGTHAECLLAVEIDCKDRFGLPGQPAGILDDLKTCLAAWAGASCECPLPAECPAWHPGPGVLADGAACQERDQCQGGRCDPAPGQACGTCVAAKPAGSSCKALGLECAAGLVCSETVSSSERTCQPPAKLCEPCADALCDVGACVGGMCAKRVGEGGDCAPFEDVCEFGYACDAGTRTCQSWWPILQGGEPCSVMLDACRGDHYCAPGDAGAVCVPRGDAGAACDGDTCLPHLACTAGQCASREALACQ